MPKPNRVEKLAQETPLGSGEMTRHYEVYYLGRPIQKLFPTHSRAERHLELLEAGDLQPEWK
jgi:hypothetical protein